MRIKNTIDSRYFSKITDIKDRSIKGGFWSMFSQFFLFSLQLVSISVLARLLNPDDYGLIAMSTAVTGFVTVFSDMGLTTSTIQSERLDNNSFSSIFWLNLFIGIGLTIVFASLSPVISWYYQDHRLLNISLLTSLTFSLNGLSSQLLALLKRIMDFKSIMFAQVTSSLIALIISVVLGFLGYGYWVLIWNVLITALVLNIILFLKFRWVPTKFVWDEKIKRMLNFGKHITFFEFINYFSRNFDNILIGKFMGASSLGFYSRAYQLLMLPITQIRGPLMNVALPALSSLKCEKERFCLYYMKYISVLTLLSSSVVILLWINSSEVILIVLGEKWITSSKIFSILAYAALIQPIYSSFGLVLIASGNSKRYSLWGIYNALIIVSSFLIGINFDLTTFTLIYVIANYFTFIFSSFYTLRDSPINVWSFFKRILPILSTLFLSGWLLKNLDLRIDSIFYLVSLKSFLFLFLTGLYVVFFFPERKVFFSLIKKR